MVYSTNSASAVNEEEGAQRDREGNLSTMLSWSTMGSFCICEMATLRPSASPRAGVGIRLKGLVDTGCTGVLGELVPT